MVHDDEPDAAAPFTLTPKACGFRIGVDPRRLGQLNDELENEESLRELRRAESASDPA